MIDSEIFGTTGEGKPVHRIRLSGGGLSASIITFGAALQDLRLDGHDAPLVLGFDDFDHYPSHSPYFGALAGRYANRIRNGRFDLDGQPVQLDCNFLGKHMLHGGSGGFFGRVWEIEESGEDFVTLSLHDPAGIMGFPGNLDVSYTYRLKDAGVLALDISATCDAPTICNLAHHSYFNLNDGGNGDILDHELMLAADAYLPVDEELIPTGAVMPVEGTAFDFQAARPIRRSEDGRLVEYDHNFCLTSQRGPLRQAVWAKGQVSGVEMELWTTEPGVQFYAGEHVARTVPGLEGRTYKSHAGFCLEPQIWPDSPNRPYFPQAMLRPGEVYRQQTEYRFRAG